MQNGRLELNEFELELRYIPFRKTPLRKAWTILSRSYELNSTTNILSKDGFGIT